MILREQVIEIVLGTMFLFIGLTACCAAAIRGRRGLAILVWFGIFSGMYGIRLLAQAPAVFSLLPQAALPARPYVIPVITYLIMVPAILFWRENSQGGLRRVLRFAVMLAAAIGIGGVGAAIILRSPGQFMPYNNALVISFLLVLAVVNAVPRLARKYLLIPSRVSTIGTLVLAMAALYVNLQEFLDLPAYRFVEPLGFAVFVFSLGYVAGEKIFNDERRLVSIENELAIAREIQNSILPAGDPELDQLRVSATYVPMAAVAGDFYEFIPVDPKRIGFLVADVSGHGVPAALIASMIKVAMQSVVASAHEPGEVMRGLNRILSSQLRGQLVSAAYLWLDTGERRAMYSAAGHPPLLRWRDGDLERIESNGLLFGILREAQYPVHAMELDPGDRFLLYTDGITEPENPAGEAFGDRKLEQVVGSNHARGPAELSTRLLSEIRQWQAAPGQQQDDITLIVIDVV